MRAKEEKALKAEWFKMKAISDVSQILATFMQEISDNGADGVQGIPEAMCHEVLVKNMEHFFGFFARDFDGDEEEFEHLFSDILEGLEERLMDSALSEKIKNDMKKGPTPA